MVSGELPLRLVGLGLFFWISILQAGVPISPRPGDIAGNQSSTSAAPARVDTETAAAPWNETWILRDIQAQLAGQREWLREELLRRERFATPGESAPAASAPGLALALAGSALLALAAFAVFGIRSLRRRRGGSLLPVRLESTSPASQDFPPATLTPQVARILKEAVVQGLAAQRHELLQAQQAAAAEMGALIRQLDELKAPMQDRLRSYEERILNLEKELAERNQENRELLRLKIEMTRRQLVAESAQPDFN